MLPSAVKALVVGGAEIRFSERLFYSPGSIPAAASGAGRDGRIYRKVQFSIAARRSSRRF